MKSLRELLAIGAGKLKNAGIEEADNDAWLLLEHAYSISRSDYYMEPSRQVDETEYLQKIQLRMKHYPLQYITGCQWFMGYPFQVNGAVLIPRQDTEMLVELAVSIIGKKQAEVLDMCTGSGCIAVSIAGLCENAKVTAVDLSSPALEVARGNSRINETDVTFLKSDLFESVEGKYDMIVSNPPYIPTTVIDGLMPEVKDYEPIMALDGSADGLEFYRKITFAATTHLKQGGYLIYEIGCEQAEDVSEMMRKNGFTRIAVHKDLSGLDRVVEGKYDSEQPDFESKKG